jgi:hypothetical protein
MCLEFTLLRKGQELGSQLHPSIDSFPCRSDVDANLLRLFRTFFSQPQTGFNYCQEIPEMIGDPARHFPQRGETLCGARPLLRGSFRDRQVKHPGEPLALYSTRVIAVITRKLDVHYDKAPRWRFALIQKLRVVVPGRRVRTIDDRSKLGIGADLGVELIHEAPNSILGI